MGFKSQQLIPGTTRSGINPNTTVEQQDQVIGWIAGFIDDGFFGKRYILGPVNKPLKLLIGHLVKDWKLAKGF